ncbi:MAG TPA: hypothetical protein VK797_23525 [Tepidisphaeraceae bacterium]|jgi:hypothetical protein|nr:hypothetical protein [Tepidisphaeraceae bacterium]
MIHKPDDQTFCYIGRRSCGCICCVTIDDTEHRKETAKDIAEWIRSGLSIERMTVAQAKADPHFFKHCPLCERRKPDVQVPLFEGASK